MIKWSWTKSHLHILILIFKMKYKNTTLYQAKCNELDSNCSVSIQDLRNTFYFYILNTTLGTGRLGDDHNQFNKVLFYVRKEITVIYIISDTVSSK